MTDYFFKRDNDNRVRVVQLNLNEHTDVTSNEKFYSITGETGLLNGKMVKRPLVTIDRGKVKRTVKEQAELQYNSLCKSYLDKGYKSQGSLGIVNITDQDDVDKKVSSLSLDSNGNLKPMLALSIDSIPTSKIGILDTNTWLASTKIDGVRSLMYYNQKENLIYTSSRGGNNYDIATTYIRQDSNLLQFFKEHPDTVLDGELYIHGQPLSYISGLVRLQNLCDRHKELKYYVYDTVEEENSFRQRLKVLNKLCEYFTDKIVVVKHHLIAGKVNIMKLHDKFVSEGYEGLVIRDADKKYKCGARDIRMIKIKVFKDDEFEITGITDGLREEDFVFNLKTKEGYPFEAKPVGDRELKKWYRDNISKLIGKLATVKYFGYTTTSTPVPNLPVMKCLRDKIDM